MGTKGIFLAKMAPPRKKNIPKIFMLGKILRQNPYRIKLDKNSLLWKNSSRKRLRQGKILSKNGSSR
jgi:hypothetical protein